MRIAINHTTSWLDPCFAAKPHQPIPNTNTTCIVTKSANFNSRFSW